MVCLVYVTRHLVALLVRALCVDSESCANERILLLLVLLRFAFASKWVGNVNFTEAVLIAVVHGHDLTLARQDVFVDALQLAADPATLLLDL